MSHRTRARGLAGIAGLALGAVVLSGCQAAAGGGGGDAAPVTATDDGTTITMWTRSSTSDFTTALVDAYNASHENQVDLTVIPFDAYQQKVGSAAGSGQLPDVVSSDVVFTPNYIQQGIFRDITTEVDALPFKDDLAPGHMSVGEQDGKNYAVPTTSTSPRCSTTRSCSRRRASTPRRLPRRSPGGSRPQRRSTRSAAT
ncbi:putative ABC transporter substrate-binding protein YesO [Clavibacter michiganensis]|uniref:Putative ABC transporter substrate-binding protein YesO n=1 Tax=Clavibacter michiganensis TaxID=28447 RepID=A0A251XUI5_9MICO|nr:putative ABC transporter substrate-binding protein YesO [Clavibacter michiganensis]